MSLLAISDLHVGFDPNREALAAIPAHPGDELILAGDVCETEEQLISCLDSLLPKFRRLFWVPGNHELWTTVENGPRGEEKYDRMVGLCRERGVLTPEDPFESCEGHVVVPLFVGYDYSFAPDGLAPRQAIDWAREAGLTCADEHFLHPDPFPTREAWCAQRCRLSLERLEAIPRDRKLVLVNHFPLRRDLVRIPMIPRFSIWCGTRKTEDWHARFNVSVVVSGHLHRRATDWRGGVRFEEVSLGYPKQWDRSAGIEYYLRRVLPE
jgi:predicted phosphodiesterase